MPDQVKCSKLTDRLRGIYTIPVNDGAGLLNGKDTFTNTFPVPPIQIKAADEIERLTAIIDQFELGKMSMDRARQLTAACVNSAMSLIGFQTTPSGNIEYVKLPEGVPLAELVAANRLVSENQTEVIEGKRLVSMVVDDRQIAAMYAFEHYECNPQQLLKAIGFRLSKCDD